MKNEQKESHQLMTPTSWTAAKKSLRNINLLTGFLCCLNETAFTAWADTIKPEQCPRYFLCECWSRYYAEFGPWFTWLGRTQISKPDTDA